MDFRRRLGPERQRNRSERGKIIRSELASDRADTDRTRERKRSSVVRDEEKGTFFWDRNLGVGRTDGGKGDEHEARFDPSGGERGG